MIRDKFYIVVQVVALIAPHPVPSAETIETGKVAYKAAFMNISSYKINVGTLSQMSFPAFVNCNAT